jgi:hypothetical protein
MGGGLGEEDRVGEGEHLPRRGSTFAFVRVPQRDVSAVGVRELPAEVDRVDDAGVHALGGGR